MNKIKPEGRIGLIADELVLFGLAAIKSKLKKAMWKDTTNLPVTRAV